MIMDKIKEELNELFMDAVYEHDHIHVCIGKAINLFTPKLQWKSEEISCNGGSTLLATVYSVINYHTSIQVYDPVNGTAGVNWNGNLVFEGTLEECKKYCSDKILDDFLKLCE